MDVARLMFTVVNIPWHWKRQLHCWEECSQSTVSKKVQIKPVEIGHSTAAMHLNFFFRIERLWRDLWTIVTNIYYDVLHYLEEEGFLNIANATHLFCCHYVFLPRLKDDLDNFHNGWDHHPLRTEGNMTRNQLWALGRIHQPIPVPDHMAVCLNIQLFCVNNCKNQNTPPHTHTIINIRNSLIDNNIPYFAK